MTETDIKGVMEGLLFAAGEEGLSLKELSSILELSTHDVEEIIYDLRATWKEQRRGLQIVQLADNFQMATLPEHSSYFSKLVHVPTRTQLSRAALETLAIIAYKQPITRLEIEEIRGVKSERILQILQRKGFINDVGRSSALGRPILYGTTNEFLDYFGLSRLDELPSAEAVFRPDKQEEDKQYLFQQLGLESS